MSYTSVAAGLADTDDLAYTGARMTGRCRAAGLDPGAYRGLSGAARVLGPYRIPGREKPYATDRELVQAVADYQASVAGRAARLADLSERAHADLYEARKLAAGKAWDELPAWLRLLIVDCLRAIQVVDGVIGNVQYAARRLQTVPVELGERYAAAYALIRGGHVLPYNGRWLTGTGC